MRTSEKLEDAWIANRPPTKEEIAEVRAMEDAIAASRICPACGWDMPQHSPQCRFFDPYA